MTAEHEPSRALYAHPLGAAAHDATGTPGRPQAAAAPQPRSSFHLAMRIMPAPQRAAMFEIYAFCRAVDDVADGDAPAQDKRAALERWRLDVRACCAGAGPAHLAALQRHIAAFHLECADFEAVIDGMLMDAQAEPVRAPPADVLDLYCDRVASAVGRLAVNVFGLPRADGVLLAHHLGRALQITNILRDIDEDAALGRAYLAREALAAAGIGADVVARGPAAIAAHPALPGVCSGMADEARAHFDAAADVMRRYRGAAVRTPRLMAAVYRVLLARLVARGWALPRTKVTIGKLERVVILLRHAFL